MSTKLNQIIAIEKGVKSRASQSVNENYKLIQKPELFSGFDKKYQPKDDEGEKLPNENKFVQYQGQIVLQQLQKSMTDLFEVTARKDWTNMVAKADVVVDGIIVVKDSPVTFLLFLEKNLTDLRTFVSSLPTLDPAEDWSVDINSGLYKTAPVSTHRTKKVQKPLVMFPATPEHPAQTQMVTEDIIAGFWTTVKLSGAVAKPQVAIYLDKIEKLIKSVKEAREEANMTQEVESPNVGLAVFGYVFS